MVISRGARPNDRLSSLQVFAAEKTRRCATSRVSNRSIPGSMDIDTALRKVETRDCTPLTHYLIALNSVRVRSYYYYCSIQEVTSEIAYRARSGFTRCSILSIDSGLPLPRSRKNKSLLNKFLERFQREGKNLRR